MSKYGIIQAYKDLPSWGKAVIAIGGLGVAVALGFTARNIIRRISANTRGKGALQDAKKYIRDLSKQGVIPTYSDFQYKAYADALHAAMNGVGTTTGQIASAIAAMKNDADVAKLIDAYNVRTVKSGLFTPDFTGNLVGALSDELTTMEIDQINYNLQQKGIKFRF